MPRVVPGQVVDLIKQIFPNVNNTTSNSLRIDSVYSASLAGIIDLVEQIPNELILLSGDDYIDFVLSINAIKTAFKKWESKPGYYLKIPGYKKGNKYERNPVYLLSKTLSKCPDEFPSSETAELEFIQDSDFRENLRIEINVVNRALSNGEWKAATILAGSVIEALLLWELTEHYKDKINETLEKLANESKINTNKKNDLQKEGLENGSLYIYIEIANSLGIFTKETIQVINLAKDFRNLIHPGREKRLEKKCDRSRALVAVGAVESVVRELKNKSI